MEKFIPEFKDDNDKLIMMTMFLSALIFMFISPLVVMLACKNVISETSYKITKAFLNFEILLLIVSILFVIVSMIPVIGWIVGILIGGIFGLVLYIANVVIILMAVFAISQKQEVKIPVLFQFI